MIYKLNQEEVYGETNEIPSSLIIDLNSNCKNGKTLSASLPSLASPIQHNS